MPKVTCHNSLSTASILSDVAVKNHGIKLIRNSSALRSQPTSGLDRRKFVIWRGLKGCKPVDHDCLRFSLGKGMKCWLVGRTAWRLLSDGNYLVRMTCAAMKSCVWLMRLGTECNDMKRVK